MYGFEAVIFDAPPGPAIRPTRAPVTIPHPPPAPRNKLGFISIHSTWAQDDRAGWQGRLRAALWAR
jgi:hypothetical protein